MTMARPLNNHRPPNVVSRERNRIHARKTRQRKKEQMQILQQRAEELKEEQLGLKQTINEKNTADILLGLFRKSDDGQVQEDPVVENLLRRPMEAIPDPSKIPELPALILPGQHASKKVMQLSSERSDGIDYELLGKDRSKCSPEELDKIRRERNRMHAKRTRDRKRIFMEEMADICRQLEDENDLLIEHLRTLDPDHEAVLKPPVRMAATKKHHLSDHDSASDCDQSFAAEVPKILPLVPRYLKVSGSSDSSSNFGFHSLLEAALHEDLKRSPPSTVSSDNDEFPFLQPIANKRQRTLFTVGLQAEV
jgi:hypothetical protein